METHNSVGGSDFRFPTDFLWGTATASHQVEGDNRANDWWHCETDGRLPYASGRACQHYELYEQDFDLMSALSQNAHRLSIEWSRLQPAVDRWDETQLEHYAAVIDALLARGIEPIVTLHHFSSPQWFTQAGGWTSAASRRHFARYVRFVVSRLAGRVKFWLTVNEPTVLIKRSYVQGVWPPCEPGSLLRGTAALRHLMAAHRSAYAIIHAARADAMVGFAHSAPYIAPCRPGNLMDRWCTWARDCVLNRFCFWLAQPLGLKALDFVAINYYSRELVRWEASRSGFLFGTECRAAHHDAPRDFSTLGWEIYPDGLRQTLRRFARFGLPLMVTENGIATDDETQRTRYISQHVEALAASLRDGLNVIGYLYWTLFDNFEWSEGYRAHFGLAAVDRHSMARTLRPAALWYAEVCANNAMVKH